MEGSLRDMSHADYQTQTLMFQRFAEPCRVERRALAQSFLGSYASAIHSIDCKSSKTLTYVRRMRLFSRGDTLITILWLHCPEDQTLEKCLAFRKRCLEAKILSFLPSSRECTYHIGIAKFLDIERDNSIVISQFTLKEVIRQTIFSIIENDNNKMMGGENIVINKDMMTVDSLDGHRISRRMIELKGEFGSVNAIIPGRTLKEISNILSGDADKDVNIFFTDNNVLFEFDNTIVLSRLIEGPYFNVDHMITKDYKIKLKINKKHLLECLDRASLLVKEGEKKPIIMNINENELKLSINSSIGNMEELIDIEKEGEDIRIGFNPKFLIDALHVIDDDEVNIYLIDSKAPCVIKNDENSYLYMILPINII